MKKGTIRKLVYLALALFVISLMLAPACAKTAPTPPAPAPAAKPTPAPAPALTPQYGGTLKMLTGTGQENIGYPPLPAPPFNPFQPHPAIENLLICDDAGNPVPNLFTSWKVDKDALTVTFTLQKGVKFHDGSDFNAAAVKFIMQALIDSGQPELPNIKSIDVVDDYTLRINMSTWDILMVNYFVLKGGNVWSPTAVQKNGKEWAQTHPVGTGPFKFDSYQKDVFLKFTKNTDYWRPGKPYLDAVQWSYVADLMTRKAAFLAGEAQLIAGMTPAVADELKKTGKYKILSSPSTVFTLYMDSINADSPWSKLEVRQAAAHAINNKELCDALGYGFYQPTNQIGYPGNPMYNPNIKGYPYDPQKAKDLLKAAGFPNGFKTTIYSGADAKDIFLAVQAYWKAVGIDADVQVVEPPRAIEISTKGWKNGVQTALPPYMAVGYPVAKMITFYFTPKSPFSVSVMRPDDIEQLRIKSLGEPTTELMNKDVQEINRMLIDKYCVCIPIFVMPNLGAKVPTLHDEKMYDPWMEHWLPENAWLEKK